MAKTTEKAVSYQSQLVLTPDTKPGNAKEIILGVQHKLLLK